MVCLLIGHLDDFLKCHLWSVVLLAIRTKYMAALEDVCVREDIRPQVLFLRDEVQTENGDRPTTVA